MSMNRVTRSPSSGACGRAAACLLAAALLLVTPAPLQAHLALVDSSPAAGEELSAAPGMLRLRFSEPVALPFAEVRLHGPIGPVGTGTLVLARDSAEVLLVPIGSPLPAGSYTVQWRVASADGHPITGEYVFSIAPDPHMQARGAVGDGAAAPPAPPPATTGSSSAAAESIGYTAVRWLNFVALLAVIGAAGFRWALIPVLRRRDADVGLAVGLDALASAARVGALAAGGFLIAGLLRLSFQAGALGMEITEAGRVAAMVTQTLWGLGWALQIGGATVALVGFAMAGSRVSGGWVLGAAGAVLAAFSPAFSGHAAAVQGPTAAAVATDGLHVLGAGGWLGTLLVVVATGLPAARRRPEEEAAPAARSLIASFSPVALAFAALVVSSGLFSAWLHLGGFADLWQSPYGRTLLLKLGLLLPVFGLGAYHWRKAAPALAHPGSLATLRRSASVELVLALFVLAVTAVLVATPPPEAAARDRVSVAGPPPEVGR